jgi:hypothetical protein
VDASLPSTPKNSTALLAQAIAWFGLGGADADVISLRLETWRWPHRAIST